MLSQFYSLVAEDMNLNDEDKDLNDDDKDFSNGAVSSPEVMKQLLSQSFESYRSLMRSGNYNQSIPILDPMVFPFPFKIPTQSSVLGKGQLLVDNLTFMGLSTFDVDQMDVNVNREFVYA